MKSRVCTNAELEVYLQDFQRLLQQECKRKPPNRKKRSNYSRATQFLQDTKTLLEHLGRSEFICTVMGITKAGKSTFINAILGAELLPSSNIPCTVGLIRVKHVPSLATPKLYQGSKLLARSFDGVRSKLASMIESGRETTATEPAPLEVQISMGFLDDAEPPGGLDFVLVDTPGVTEAGGAKLTRSTLHSFRRSDACLFALNYTALGTDGERTFISRCVRERPGHFLNPGKRFFCVITKIDRRDRHGVGFGEVTRQVQQQINGAIKGRLPDKDQSIWPVRAELALRARAIQAGVFDQGILSDYLNDLFGRAGRNQHITEQQLMELTETSVNISRIQNVERKLKSQLVLRCDQVRREAVRGRLVHLLNRTNGWARGTSRHRLSDEVMQLKARL